MLTKYYSDEQIKENGIDEACDALRCREKVDLSTRICLGNTKEGNRLEYLRADERIILKLVLKRGKMMEHGRGTCYSG